MRATLMKSTKGWGGEKFRNICARNGICDRPVEGLYLRRRVHGQFKWAGAVSNTAGEIGRLKSIQAEARCFGAYKGN